MTRRTEWWMNRTAYQIYPRSFADANGDGVGDIPGIIDRLHHLADLGIGLIWLSPVYRSPMADNGYDISDYQDIAPEYGTLADFDRLVAEADRRDIGIIMDLVVNHSSDRHPWFQEAKQDRASPFHDFYYWRDPAPDGGPPDDRKAYFGGPVWTFYPEVGRYVFNLFSPQQPDLNWQNPALRQAVYDMMRWWLDRGVRGFRMDVIDLIGKDIDRDLITEGPYLHDFLQEMHREVLAGRDVVTVGESWNVTKETALLYCGRDRGELDMVFQFQHIVAGWDRVHGKWRPHPLDLVAFKKVWTDWQEALEVDGWNSLFLNNHDLPRSVSRYGDAGQWRERSAKALATAIHLMRGTPFVFQGEEIGMTNAGFTEITHYRDIELINMHREMLMQGLPEHQFLEGAGITARDNARTPMQWDTGPGAGFTTGEPWIAVNPNSAEINVAAQRDDPNSVLAHYRHLVALRKQHEVIVQGRFVSWLEDHPQIWAYTREWDNQRLSVLCNISSEPARTEVPPGLASNGTCLICTAHPRHSVPTGPITLEPWEALVVLGNLG
ncbi:alpha-glucosidase [Paracoccus sp. SY]|uniref:alpha-glucosidase n=1 Tax=Paracoccus sp. SY TaxID=1330255 RepID=UPI000CD07357|nr:alpha-glucosidase [Paracoccus sp. SY]